MRLREHIDPGVVPVGTVKAMYVVTNLALARDVALTLIAE
jgi:hypothetical protein